MSQSERHYLIIEASQTLGLEPDYVWHCVRAEWIMPAQASQREEDLKLDEEDLARIRLIHELQREFGVNDESVSIILNLLDQLHYLQGRARAESGRLKVPQQGPRSRSST